VKFHVDAFFPAGFSLLELASYKHPSFQSVPGAPTIEHVL
jgi:hypothetical protein